MNLSEKETLLNQPRSGLPIHNSFQLDIYRLKNIINQNLISKDTISSDTITTVDDVRGILEIILNQTKHNRSDHVFDNLYQSLSKLDLKDYAEWLYKNEFYYHLPFIHENILIHFDLIDIYVLSSFFKKMFN